MKQQQQKKKQIFYNRRIRRKEQLKMKKTNLEPIEENIAVINYIF